MVNTLQAGVGHVTCRIITPSGTYADVEIQENSNGMVSVFYTPRIRGDYTVEVRFGGELVPNGRFNQKAFCGLPKDTESRILSVVGTDNSSNRSSPMPLTGYFTPYEDRLV
ncbi:unnamed protein product [Protopolystoma xenopodis]|uniref:Uncharacterized protein n=1 Tax=Protopolystoma xenopodis TaxID=117903 RepID=A0A3S5BVF8_9PLAT|nr:unnamed protein product [Protopolystoma xenopodis]